MNAITQSWTINIHDQAALCGATPAFFKNLKDAIYKDIENYDPVYGAYMIKHLERTSNAARDFLYQKLGIDQNTANIIADAFSLHDAGKILQDIALWQITSEKPVRSAEDKLKRTEHGELGVQVLNTAIKKLGLILTDEEQRFIALTEQLMVMHHERLDGSGPQGMRDLDIVLRALAIIDQIDGKAKTNKPLSDSFEDMSGKHLAEFDQTIVALYKDWCRETDLQAIATPAQGQRLQN